MKKTFLIVTFMVTHAAFTMNKVIRPNSIVRAGTSRALSTRALSGRKALKGSSLQTRRPKSFSRFRNRKRVFTPSRALSTISHDSEKDELKEMPLSTQLKLLKYERSEIRKDIFKNGTLIAGSVSLLPITAGLCILPTCLGVGGFICLAFPIPLKGIGAMIMAYVLSGNVANLKGLLKIHLNQLNESSYDFNKDRKYLKALKQKIRIVNAKLFLDGADEKEQEIS